MQRDKNITRSISRFAGIVLAFVVILIPFGYFLVSYQYMAGILETEAEINARIITQIISANPKMWEFEQVRLEEYLARRPGRGHAETRRIFNLNSELVAQKADSLAPPVMTRSAALFDAGVVVGRIETSRSLQPLLVRSGTVMLLMLPLGAGVFLVLRILPIRAIQRSEENLKKERDRAQTYLDVAGVMLVAIDASGFVTMINRKGCEILGCPEQQALHKSWFDNFVPDNIRAAVKQKFTSLMENDGEQGGYFENPVLTNKGEVRTIAWHNIVLRDESGKAVGTLSSGEDVTERQRLEAQLRQAQKMEAVGVLAGGVAHDFNNILTGIIGYTNLVKMKLPENDPLQYNVGRVLELSDRAAHLVKSLLAYSRKQIIQPIPIPVNEIVREVEKLLVRLLGEDIELRAVLSKADMTIKADPGQIEQVLMNLAINARDAMPEGGLLTIETAYRELDDEFIITHGFGARGKNVMLAVSDTGMGMTEAVQKRIFDPFFTTKEVGKGTGLGLAMVYGIIKQHNGFINVYSEPGKGTTFRIYLPLIESTVERGGRTRSLPPAGGSETILIAEDDEPVRTLTASMLREAGYTIIEAMDGEDALSKFSAHKDEIRLAVLDVIMPKKNGKHVFDALKTIRPDIKALFVSGYPADILQKQLLFGPDMHYLSKPASAKELLGKVREMLDT